MFLAFCIGKPKYNIHPANCSRFIICEDDGLAYAYNCQPGLRYNKEKELCDWEYNIPECEVTGIWLVFMTLCHFFA